MPLPDGMIRDAQHLRRAGGDEVEQTPLISVGEEAEQVSSEERYLRHVVPTKGIISILDVVLTQGDRHAEPVEQVYREMPRTGMRIGHEPQAGPACETREAPLRRLGIGSNRPRMARDAAALETVLEHGLRQHRRGGEGGIVRVVNKHRYGASE